MPGKKPMDWDAVEWSQQNRDIAEQFQVSAWKVHFMRKRLRKPNPKLWYKHKDFQARLERWNKVDWRETNAVIGRTMNVSASIPVLVRQDFRGHRKTSGRAARQSPARAANSRSPTLPLFLESMLKRPSLVTCRHSHGRFCESGLQPHRVLQQDVKMREELPTGRDAAFRRGVLGVYDYRYSACDIRALLTHAMSPTEAAHRI